MTGHGYSHPSSQHPIPGKLHVEMVNEELLISGPLLQSLGSESEDVFHELPPSSHNIHSFYRISAE